MAQKYSTEICERNHAGEVPQRVLETLPLNQGHPVRHRCAACAYLEGKKEAANDTQKLVAQIQQLTQENERLKQASDSEEVADEATELGSLVDSYPATEFRNLTRSTVSLLAYWRDLDARLRALAEQLDAPDLVDAIVTPEFSTPSPGGKASFTDLLVESAKTAVGIEVKRTERRYQLVRDWRTSAHRRRVLNHWCSLIRPRTSMPADASLDALVYQMIHRTASVCARPAERAIVLYQLFGSEHADEYEQDLRALVEVLRPTPKLEVWLQIVPTVETSEYAVIARTLPGLSPAARVTTIKRAIVDGVLFRFSDAAPRRIGA